MFGDLQHFGDLLHRNAQYSARRIGIVDEDVRMTWRAVNARANRLASALQKRGVGHGDRVAIVSRNSHQYVEALFGLAKIGVVSVPINYRLAGPEVEFILKDAGAVVLISDREHFVIAESVASHVEVLEEVVVLGEEAPGGGIAYEALIREGDEAEPMPDRPIEPQDLLLFLYTSGTTGFPKGVMYTHHGTLVGMFVHAYAIGSHSSHRVMLPAPLYSAAGIAGIFCAVYVGSYSVLIDFEPQRALETIQRERITFTNLVPTTIQMLMSREDIDRYDLSSLRLLLYGGAPISEPIMRQAAQVFRCDLRQTYATAETGCSGTVLEPHEHRLALEDPRWAKLIASCGRPQCNIGLRIVGADGVDAKPGEVGQICIYSDGNMAGYWNDPVATKETLRDGWVYTGDLARADEDGWVYLVDRKNDMIVSGALNVYPSEVERILHQHPAVLECAVIGIPDELWGEAVKAVVVKREGVSVTDFELTDYCKERLAGFKAPKSVDFVNKLPRNLAGKVLRRVLREPYWEGETRKF